MMARRSTRWTGARSTDLRHVQFGEGDGGGSPTGHLGVGEVSDLAGRNVVAAEHLAGGRLRTAVSALESLLNDCRRRLGAEHPETLVVEGNLAVAYVMIGQHEAGAQLMLANLGGRERVFGDEHPLTLTARDALATTYRLAGRLSEAMWLYSRVAPQRNRVLGPSHPDTLTTRLGLGLTLAEAGDTAMALDVVTAALQDCEQVGVADEHAAILRSCLSDLRREGAANAPEADSTEVDSTEVDSAREVASAPEVDSAGEVDSAASGTTVPQPRSHSTLVTDVPLPLQHDHEQCLTVGIGPSRERDGLT
jgi:hypothetical protein